MILKSFKYGLIALLMVMATATAAHHTAAFGDGVHGVEAHHPDQDHDLGHGTEGEICHLSCFGQADFAGFDMPDSLIMPLSFAFIPDRAKSQNVQNRGGRPYPARGPPLSFA